MFPPPGGVGGVCSGGNVSDGGRWGAADEALLACAPLTSCCAARFLIGTGPWPGGWGLLHKWIAQMDSEVVQDRLCHQSFFIILSRWLLSSSL